MPFKLIFFKISVIPRSSEKRVRILFCSKIIVEVVDQRGVPEPLELSLGVHGSCPRPLGTLEIERASFLLLQQLGGCDEILRLKSVRVQRDCRFGQPFPNHLGIVVVPVGGGHLNA